MIGHRAIGLLIHSQKPPFGADAEVEGPAVFARLDLVGKHALPLIK